MAGEDLMGRQSKLLGWELRESAFRSTPYCLDLVIDPLFHALTSHEIPVVSTIVHESLRTWSLAFMFLSQRLPMEVTS